MSQTTFANGRGIAHKNSPGTGVAFPNVCKIKTPAGDIPIPLPNMVAASDLTDGPVTVTCDGAMPACKGAKCSKSSGDEAGSAGGVISGVNSGPAEVTSYSFDVKFEGRGVSRLGDKLTYNKRNVM